MASSSADVKQLITKAVNGAVTKVLASLEAKSKRQEERESGSDDDFQAVVTPLTKKRKTKDTTRYAEMVNRFLLYGGVFR